MLRIAQINDTAKDKQSPASAALSLKTMLASPPGFEAATTKSCGTKVVSCESTLNTNNEEAQPTGSVQSLSEPAADDAAPRVSKGSQLHSTGQCKPCACFGIKKAARMGLTASTAMSVPRGESRCDRRSRTHPCVLFRCLRSLLRHRITSHGVARA
eukprot:TRINITY_DN30239_c0_g1_i1.p1 TRINITY_DN30239_c0_g1~~TRINITY_DN30239_c0_g1_i1.p1  ORF type:complete len:156 (-),score=20.52 TRINITY_DN30239_c0_g1_i1:17-484(-)